MPTARPFVGRRAELALLTTLLEQVRRSGRARTIAVRGEAGIGKSSLLQALVRTANDLGVAVHTLNVLDFGQSAADRPIPALALYLLGGEAEASSSDRAAAVERAANDRTHRARGSRDRLRRGRCRAIRRGGRTTGRDGQRDAGPRAQPDAAAATRTRGGFTVVAGRRGRALGRGQRNRAVGRSRSECRGAPCPRSPDVPDAWTTLSLLHGGPGAGAARSRRSTLRRSRRTRRANLRRHTRAFPTTSSNAVSAPRSVIRFFSSSCCVRPGSGR